MAGLGLARREESLVLGSDPDNWVRDGQQMAKRDPRGVFDAIKGKHIAETSSFQAASHKLKVEGQTVLARRQELIKALEAAGFDAGRHLRDVAQAKLDLLWAVGLLLVNMALALIVLLGLGPAWVTFILAFLVLATALPVEEFFIAHDDKAAFREGVFVTLSLIGLAATFWLGGLRGLFLGAITAADIGPANQALKEASRILQFSLAGLAVVSEVLCGYKFYRWRKNWHSSTAHAARERDTCDGRLKELHGSLKGTEVEADIRREYRTIGANQELARQANPNSNHLQRAVSGAVIALIVLAILFLLAPFATAGPKPSVPRPVVVLFDLTASTRPETFAANTEAVRQLITTLASEQRLVLIGIADSFGNSPILLDKRLPQQRHSLFGLELRAAQEQLISEWNRVSKTRERQYQRTDVIGALSMVNHIAGIGERPIRLIVLSDLRQSVGTDLERPAQIDVKRSLEKTERHSGLPALGGSDVHLLGVDPIGKSAKYYRELRRFWTEFFAAAGAKVETFSVDRGLPTVLGPGR